MRFLVCFTFVLSILSCSQKSATETALNPQATESLGLLRLGPKNGMWSVFSVTDGVKILDNSNGRSIIKSLNNGQFEDTKELNLGGQTRLFQSPYSNNIYLLFLNRDSHFVEYPLIGDAQYGLGLAEFHPDGQLIRKLQLDMIDLVGNNYNYDGGIIDLGEYRPKSMDVQDISQFSLFFKKEGFGLFAESVTYVRGFGFDKDGQKNWDNDLLGFRRGDLSVYGIPRTVATLEIDENQVLVINKIGKESARVFIDEHQLDADPKSSTMISRVDKRSGKKLAVNLTNSLWNAVPVFCGGRLFLIGEKEVPLGSPNNTTERDINIAELDMSLQVIQSKSFHFKQDDWARSARCGPNQQIYIAGVTDFKQVDTGSWFGGDALVARFSLDLELLEMVSFGHKSRLDQAYQLYVTSDRVIVTGMYGGTPSNHSPTEERWSFPFFVELPLEGWELPIQK